jgi:hypothetical protein
MKNNVVIELEQHTLMKIIDSFKDKKICLDLEHVPFNEYTIKYSYGKDFEKSEIKRLIREGVSKERAKILIKESLDITFNTLSINVKIKGNKIIVDNHQMHMESEAHSNILDSDSTLNTYLIKRKEVSELYLSSFTPLEFKDLGNLSEDEKSEITINNIQAIAVLAYLQLPSASSICNVDSKIVLNDKRKKNKKKGNNNKTYIYKKTYFINYENIDKVFELDKEHIRRNYQRKTSQWQVRGHWRTYANGKRIWIKPTTKRSRKCIENNVNPVKEYKISRVDL